MGIADTAESWETVDSRTPFQGAKTSVSSDRVRMPDGSLATRDYQVHPGSVCVVALDADGAVLVLRQYRHPVRHRLWELPAGLLDVPGENPLHAAQRELYEEAHVKAETWNVLVDFFASPGGSDEAVRVFLARDLSEAEGERYAGEGEEADMELARVPLADLVRGVLEGRFGNAALATGVLALATALAAPGGLTALRPADAAWPARPYRP
ncbi:NUDIX hydrolase [Streptomyces sp. NPDC046876]|uniref:NUDIX hydrolase n=1 Tax=Streptomyces sp. NPDC046876 TaxID=3155616 RepID=UPI0033F87BAB